MRYGAVAGLALVLVGGAVYLSNRTDTAEPSPTIAAHPAAAPRLGARPGASSDEPDVPSAADTERVARLLGDARRLAYDGNFAEANAALDQAQAILPGSTGITQLRQEITEIAK